MSFTQSVFLGAAAAVLAVGTALAGGHGGNPAVKARQAHMQLYAHNLGILGGMAKGEVDFDAGAAQAAADSLAALAGIDETSYWAADTSSIDLDETRALPDIWDAYSDFQTKQVGLLTAATAMQAAAGTLEGVQANMGAVGGACGACHKAYRQPSN